MEIFIFFYKRILERDCGYLSYIYYYFKLKLFIIRFKNKLLS